MTTTDPDWHEDTDDLDDNYAEPDDFDDWDGPDPDPSDYEESRAYAEHVQHCEDVHGGGECDCRPPLADRARNAARRARFAWARLTRRASAEPPF